MSKAKHTPAPWSANEATITYTQFNITAKDSFIGEVGGGLQSDDEIEANARLIAEAPTLKDTLSSARVVLARMRRSMMAHPDHEVGSEFDDLTTESQILEDEIMELIMRIEG